MDKHYLSANDFLRDVWRLAASIRKSEWKPDFLIALWRGGTPPGIAIHEFLKATGWDVRHLPLKCASYTGIGANEGEVKFTCGEVVFGMLRKGDRVLIVDDVFDTGKTAAAVKERLDAIGVDFRMACVYWKPGKNQTDLRPDYYTRDVGMDWIVFPHEIEGLTLDEIRTKDPVLADFYGEVGAETRGFRGPQPEAVESSDALREDVRIIRELQSELLAQIRDGSDCGPFLAAIYDREGHRIAGAANSVVKTNCSHGHAEMNAIRLAEERFGTWDLAPRDLVLYTTSEPCMMCAGGILWSGIRKVVYGVPSARVEAITGFDEGFKPDWKIEFSRRGIEVVGPLAVEEGEAVHREYMRQRKPVYAPARGK